MVIQQGDIFYVNFSPSKGYERPSRSPAIALSHDFVQASSGITIVAPTSNTSRNFPTYYPLTETEKIPCYYSHLKIAF
ncbi:type II toxin-antitoxin system PemK/MazF family toxin [Fundicoccus sp. Sow4_H7]|uniref:type II toxin-antitoxin system PemK/MazF family toxin n=1 Tax=Fundicoccus sp. Sow4_H7 TaxID=3438784 RepID=UPI003F9343B9